MAKQGKERLTEIVEASLVVQGRLCTSNAWGTGLIPGWGTKILHAAWYRQKNLKKKLKKKKKK